MDAEIVVVWWVIGSERRHPFLAPTDGVEASKEADDSLWQPERFNLAAMRARIFAKKTRQDLQGKMPAGRSNRAEVASW